MMPSAAINSPSFLLFQESLLEDTELSPPPLYRSSVEAVNSFCSRLTDGELVCGVFDKQQVCWLPHRTHTAEPPPSYHAQRRGKVRTFPYLTAVFCVCSLHVRLLFLTPSLRETYTDLLA